MIHKFSLFGKNIVLDVNSGSIHLMDNVAFRLLDCISLPMDANCPEHIFKKFKFVSKFKIAEAYKEIRELYNKGLLFFEDNYSDIKLDENTPIKALCLHVAHDCNLRCLYCFASKGGFGGTRMLMPFDVAKKSIDFLIEKSGNRHNLEVDFFGGEPLLNFEVVKKTVQYARTKEKKFNKHFRFTITTNGVLLDTKKINYINKEMDNVVLSLDGRKKINDKMRPTPNNKGSYDLIMPKYKELVSKRGDKDYYLRGTFTKNNLDFSKDIFDIYKNGFEQISVEPVIASEDKRYAIVEQDIPKIKKEYEKVGRKIIKLNKKGKFINFFHFMIDLNEGPCVIKKIKGCGCGSEYLAVTPEGDLYPCHQFVGQNNWKMGNIHDNTVDKTIKDKFLNLNIYSKDECKTCWAKFYCSGGCNANNLQFTHSLFKPYKISCELEKKRIECALAIKACTMVEY